MKFADSGIGIWIYLILFVVGSIISAAKKKADAARPKPLTKDHEDENEDIDPWKEIFEKSFKEPEIVPKESKVKHEEKVVPAAPKTVTGKSTIIPSTSLLSTNYDDLIKQSEISISKEEEIVETNFNVRDAVIYSEILNRKYF